jgi:hypothetical protein
LIEVCDDSADGLIVAAKLTGNHWGSLLARHSHQHLTAAQHKGFFGMQSCLDGMLFFVTERTDKGRCFHDFYHSTSLNICPAIALGLAVDTGCAVLIERARVNPS